MSVAPVIAICVGASLGALSRWGLSLWLNHPSHVIPYGTLAANLIGAYLIGAAIALFQTMPQLDPVWRLLLITGFLGGLTTFSSFSAEVVTQLLEGRLAAAACTAMAHLAGSLALTWAGILSARAVLAR